MAQHQVLLSMLQGPSKALVASAFAGGIANLALSSRSPALCYVARVPYDDDAFKVRPGTYRNALHWAAAACSPPPLTPAHR